MSSHSLDSTTIQQLAMQGCSASDWNAVRFTEPFDPSCFHHVRFDGEVLVGSMVRTEEAMAPPDTRCGLHNCSIENCKIGDRVRIENVGRLASYHIGEGTVLRNTHPIAMEGISAFGNGVELNVVNEAGGRTLRIFDRLSSQLAYLIVMFRHDHHLIERLNEMISSYLQEKTLEYGVIGEECLIEDCGTIRNLYLHPYSTIQGAQHLENGTLVSEKEAPTYIGAGVQASNFIIQSGSRLDTHVLLNCCFVGQGVKIEKQFSAEHSVFFANCEMMHGEACSLFAGPYTVSHHKSTLLIASLLSFFNAGSGTNQSNHMYKLGPVHQGIVERGSKTGSSSYLLWPSRVGPFSVVIGKLYNNFDSSSFPFSYIKEEEGRSVLTPAMNLFTVGVIRDSEKWPTRDRRTSKNPLDLITYELWNPYIAERLRAGINTLTTLSEQSQKKQEYVHSNGVSIKRLMLKTCRKYYEMAIRIFIGETMLLRIREFDEFNTIEELNGKFTVEDKQLINHWVDLAGWIAPANSVNQLLESTKKGEISSIEDLYQNFLQIEKQYENNKFAFCQNLIEEIKQKPFDQFNKEDYIELISDWEDKKIKFLNMVSKDAQKEFDNNARIGYGMAIDENEDSISQDFQTVRGSVETNSFIQNLAKEIETVKERAQKFRKLINQMR